MRSLTAPATSALTAVEVVYAILVKIQFPSGVIALNSSIYELVWGGVTYLGAAGLGRVSATTDRPGEVAGLTLELLNVDATYIALALDDADQVQGSVVTISTALMNDEHQIIDVQSDWVGYADVMSISENGEKATISLSTESKAVDLLRGTPLLYNDADQQSLVPGDRYFEYVASQTDKPVVWPTREWFFK